MVRIRDEIMSYKYSGNLQAERRKRRHHYSALGIGLETFQQEFLIECMEELVSRSAGELLVPGKKQEQ